MIEDVRTQLNFKAYKLNLVYKDLSTDSAIIKLTTATRSTEIRISFHTDNIQLSHSDCGLSEEVKKNASANQLTLTIEILPKDVWKYIMLYDNTVVTDTQEECKNLKTLTKDMSGYLEYMSIKPHSFFLTEKDGGKLPTMMELPLFKVLSNSSLL